MRGVPLQSAIGIEANIHRVAVLVFCQTSPTAPRVTFAIQPASRMRARMELLLAAATIQLGTASALMGEWQHLRSSSSPDTSEAVFLRHCNFYAFGTKLGCHSGTDIPDSSFKVVQGSDGAIRLHAEYGNDDYFFAVNAGSDSGAAPERLLLQKNDGSTSFRQRSTWNLSSVGDNSSVLATEAPGYVGFVLTLNSTLSGYCSGEYSTSAGEGNAIVASITDTVPSIQQRWHFQSEIPLAPAVPATATIDPKNVSSFNLPNKLSVGIEFLNHEIYGFGLGAQMVFGESFEEVENGQSDVPVGRGSGVAQQGFIGCQGGRTNDSSITAGVSEMWTGVLDGGAAGSFKLVASSDDAFQGAQYQRFTYDASTGGSGPGPRGGQSGGDTRVGLANYGLNCQHGMSFRGAMPYEGYSYLRVNAEGLSGEAAERAMASGSVQVSVALEDWSEARTAASKILDEVTLTVPADGQWHKLPFTLTAASPTDCGSMVGDGSYPDGYSTCFGRFTVFSRTPGASIDVDLTWLQPGAWGVVYSPRSGSMGLPARLDVAEQFKVQGIDVFRNGGSMDNRDTYRWKDFRGPRDQRQPYQGLWYKQKGLTQSRAFAMFEIIDLCDFVGCEPVITINNLEKPEDMGDFVEYAWGDASTKWGKQRIQDGHPEPYNVSWIECGNEQGLDHTLLYTCGNITQAMDARSKAIGAPLFRYAIGHNLQGNELNQPILREFIYLFLPQGDRMYWDWHIEDGEAGAADREANMVTFQSLVESLGSKMRWVCFEENGNDHGLARGIGHAAYSMMYARHGDFAPVQGFADAIQAWQGMDAEQAFPQGAVFTFPNSSFLQPPGHVIRMLHETKRPKLIGLELEAGNATGFDAVAVGNMDGSDVVLKAVNWSPTQPVKLSLQIKGGGAAGGHGQLLAGPVALAGGLPDGLADNSPGVPDYVSPVEVLLTAGEALSLPPLSFVVLHIESN